MRWQENVEQTVTEKKSCIRCIPESVQHEKKNRSQLYPKRFLNGLYQSANISFLLNFWK
jgi:hypothetical protein